MPGPSLQTRARCPQPLADAWVVRPAGLSSCTARDAQTVPRCLGAEGVFDHSEGQRGRTQWGEDQKVIQDLDNKCSAFPSADAVEDTCDKAVSVVTKGNHCEPELCRAF